MIAVGVNGQRSLDAVLGDAVLEVGKVAAVDRVVRYGVVLYIVGVPHHDRGFIGGQPGSGVGSGRGRDVTLAQTHEHRAGIDPVLILLLRSGGVHLVNVKITVGEVFGVMPVITERIRLSTRRNRHKN